MASPGVSLLSQAFKTMANSSPSGGGATRAALASGNASHVSAGFAGAWSSGRQAPIDLSGSARVLGVNNTTRGPSAMPRRVGKGDARRTLTVADMRTSLSGRGPSSPMSNRPIPPAAAVAPTPAISMPSPNRGRGGPTPITMPKPRGPNLQANQAVNSASEASEVLMGMGSGMAAGALGSAVFNNKEGTFSGAISAGARGAVAGGLGGAIIGGGTPGMMKALTNNTHFMDRAGSMSTNLTKMTSAMHTSEGRTAMYAGGGLLSGYAFGGSNNSKKRGFNKHRGNSFSSNGS